MTRHASNMDVLYGRRILLSTNGFTSPICYSTHSSSMHPAPKQHALIFSFCDDTRCEAQMSLFPDDRVAPTRRQRRWPLSPASSTTSDSISSLAPPPAGLYIFLRGFPDSLEGALLFHIQSFLGRRPTTPPLPPRRILRPGSKAPPACLRDRPPYPPPPPCYPPPPPPPR